MPTPKQPPSAPSNLEASVSDGVVSLQWVDTSNKETRQELYRCAGPNCSGFALYQTLPRNVESTSDSDVEEGQTYRYRVRAVNSYGPSAYSNTVTVEILAAPPPALPDAPTNVTAVAGDGTVTIAATEPADFDTFILKRGTAANSLSTNVTGLLTADYVDNAVTNGTRYYYAFVTVFNGEQSLDSQQASATPTASTPPPSPPAAPQNLVAVAGILRVDLTWSLVNGATYTIKRRTSLTGSYTTLASGGTAPSYADTAVIGGTTYYYVVTATVNSLTSGNSNEVTAVPTSQPTPPPEPPPPQPAGGFDVPIGVTVAVPAGTYTHDQLLALSPGSGTATGWKRFRPVAGAAVVLRGGFEWEAEYIYLDGSTGANQQLLIDGLLNPSYPTSSAMGSILANHMRLSHAECRGSGDFHYCYALDNTPNVDESVGTPNNGGYLAVQGSDVQFKYCLLHGNYTFLSDLYAGTLTLEKCIVRNFFNLGTSIGGWYFNDSVVALSPNHGTNFATATGGVFDMRNTLYLISQEMPTMNDSGISLGVDTCVLLGNSFIMPNCPWAPGGIDAYKMDGIGITGATAADGVRVSGTIRNNVVRSFAKRVFALYTQQIPILNVDYNLWYSSQSDLFRSFSSYPFGGEVTYTFNGYKTATGLDAHSQMADPVFQNAPAFTDPQPNPGSAGNYWGYPAVSATGTIAQQLVAIRAQFLLAPTSPGIIGAEDGGPIGIRTFAP